jgi:hypothetical protein
MDSVRFGRALGMGARHATKALMEAADAAASPDPSPKCAPSAGPSAPQSTAPQKPMTQAASLGQKAARTTAQVRQTTEGISRGSKQFRGAIWGPLVKLSGVLWLELSGVFFGLFLLTALTNAWKLRASVHDNGINHELHEHFLWSLAMAAVFGYFCLSSFVKASRRQRRS